MIIKKILGKPFFLAFFLCFVSIAFAQEKSKTTEENRYLKLIDSSFLYSSKQDYAQACRCLQQAIREDEQNPLNIYLLNNIGGLQQIQGLYDEAILSYSVALMKNPNEQTIRFNRAKLYALRQKYKAAITDYSILVSQNPNNELYLYQRAMTYILNQNLSAAELDLEDILKNNNESLKARIGLALCKTLNRQYDEAEKIYDFLVEKLPKTAEVYEGRAKMYLARQMMGFAERDINKAFELSQSHISPSLYRLRAELYEAQGNKNEAQKDLLTAIKLEQSLDPSNLNKPNNEP